jgi:hypothetical protein
MQGGKNWILPKEMNANRFFWDSHWLEIWSNHFCPSMGPNGVSVAMDSVLYRVHCHAPSIRSHRETIDFQPMRVSEKPVCIYLFLQTPVFTTLHLRSPAHVVPPLW